MKTLSRNITKCSFAERVLRPLPAFALLLVCAFGNAEAESSKNELDEIDALISAWRIEEAQKRLTPLLAQPKVSPRVHYLAGLTAFSDSRLDSALEHLRIAIEGSRAELSWKELRDRVELTKEAFSNLGLKVGPSGLFVFRVTSPLDELLIPYADEALREQRRVLASAIGHMPERPVEIAILPHEEALAQASGLTLEQIQRTGTVGVSKYGRIMILTPRRLSSGYPWLDTLAHELTHIAVTRASMDEAPVWLHEGIAKFFERSWRKEELQGSLTPEEAYLLDRAAREGRLIPLRRFHPSIAHLPNQEDAALAYAQVLSLVGYITDRTGEGWIRAVLEGLANKHKLDAVLTEQTRFPLTKNYNWWKQSISGKRQTPIPAVELMKKRFKRGKTVGDSGVEALLGSEVRKHLRIGDLLRLRGHVRAAVEEYRWASEASVSPSVEITDRVGACLLELGENEEAAKLLEPMAELYPLHSAVFIQFGQALARLGRFEHAAKVLNQAVALNPFHPEVHCTLAEVYGSLNQLEESTRSAGNCQRLTVMGGSEVIEEN